jgi:hypothetical protein
LLLRALLLLLLLLVQVPLHAGAPPTDGPLRMSSLDDTPRVACASLLVRIMTPGEACTCGCGVRCCLGGVVEGLDH